MPCIYFLQTTLDLPPWEASDSFQPTEAPTRWGQATLCARGSRNRFPQFALQAAVFVWLPKPFKHAIYLAEHLPYTNRLETVRTALRILHCTSQEKTYIHVHETSTLMTYGFCVH